MIYRYMIYIRAEILCLVSIKASILSVRLTIRDLEMITLPLRLSIMLSGLLTLHWIEKSLFVP
jgi:hypothetical protein